MTIIAHICERYTMQLEDTTEPWFADWVLRSPKEAGIHLTAGWLATSSLRDLYEPQHITSAREYFGGMGAQALMIHELFDPELHVAMDFSQEATTHMRNVLPENIYVRQSDAYDPSSCSPADLVALDFGDLTVWKTREGQEHRKLLDRVFAHRPKAVLLTDIACRYLHLHRERYETLLGPGTCDTYEHYLYALIGRLEELYGYTLVAGFSHRWSTVMALVPEHRLSSRGTIVDTPLSPVGIELL